MKTLLTFAALGAVALSGCAASDMPMADGQSRSASTCFSPGSVTNFRGDDALVYIRTTRNQVFELSTGGCSGVNSANGLTITPFPASGRVCVGDTVDLMLSDETSRGFGPPQCRARVQRMLTREQAAALPSRLQP